HFLAFEHLRKRWPKRLVDDDLFEPAQVAIRQSSGNRVEWFAIDTGVVLDILLNSLVGIQPDITGNHLPVVMHASGNEAAKPQLDVAYVVFQSFDLPRQRNPFPIGEILHLPTTGRMDKKLEFLAAGKVEIAP